MAVEARRINNSRKPWAVINPNAVFGDEIVAGFLTEEDAHMLASAINARDDLVPALARALERLKRNFDLLLEGRPVRDVAETEAEVLAALAKAQGQ